MKKITRICFLASISYVYAYGQDTTPKVKIPPPYEIKGGRYNITIYNGKIKAVKNPSFDESKVLRREIPRKVFDQITEIYLSGNPTPIIKQNFVCDRTSVDHETLLSRKETQVKYGYHIGVTAFYLKPGVIPLNTSQLYTKFKIPIVDQGLPLYVNYHPIAKPEQLMGVPEAILSINVVKDSDGLRFLNIMTKEWKEYNDKHPNEVYIR